MASKVVDAVAVWDLGWSEYKSLLRLGIPATTKKFNHWVEIERWQWRVVWGSWQYIKNSHTILRATSHPTTIEVVLEVIGSIGCECDWCDECDSNSYLHTRWSPPHLDADQQICTQQRHLAHTICPIPPIFTKHLIWSLECVNVACWLFKITLLTVLYPYQTRVIVKFDRSHNS